MLNDSLYIVLLGIGATVFMDLWALFLKVSFGIPSLNYGLVGRWIGHILKGKWFHKAISESSPIKAELSLGWVMHYLIGVVFAYVFVLIFGMGWLQNPTLLPALIFGLGTVVFPFFFMQPCFGMGIAASKLPTPNVARFRSLMAHGSFGFGLYISAYLFLIVS